MPSISASVDWNAVPRRDMIPEALCPLVGSDRVLDAVEFGARHEEMTVKRVRLAALSDIFPLHVCRDVYFVYSLGDLLNTAGAALVIIGAIVLVVGLKTSLSRLSASSS